MDTTTTTRLATWAEASPFLAPLVREVEGRRITDAIDADPAEVARLRESRRQAEDGRRHPR